MKDFYDLGLLSRLYPFDEQSLARAIIATFRQRGTTVNSNPLASRKRIAMTPRVSFSGGHSYGGAGSEKRNVT